MWRKCDLHIHSQPDDKGRPRASAREIVEASAQSGLDVIALTDHNDVSLVEEVVDAAHEHGIIAVPGVEISTDAGHVLCYTPGEAGIDILDALLRRLGAHSELERAVDFHHLREVLDEETTPTGIAYSEVVVAVGAHVNRGGSLLSGDASGTHDKRMRRARSLHAIEVNDDAVRKEWVNAGVKSRGESFPIMRFSDAHLLDEIGRRHTWLYLPDGSRESFLQALATFNNSVRFGETTPDSPDSFITSLSISGGLHGGVSLDFSSRVNAIIGPPSVGKSLLVDALRFAFIDPCEIDEVSELSRARMERHLPEGTVVTVELQHQGSRIEVKREVGGASTPDVPIHPIVFSQTELTRRAMQDSPALNLIDVHVPELDALYDHYGECRSHVSEQVRFVLVVARDIADLRAEIHNPVDGLRRVEEQLAEFGGSETLANESQSIEAVLSWRETVGRRIEELSTPVIDIKELPLLPELAEEHGEDLKAAMPREEVLARVARARDELADVVESLKDDIKEMLGDNQALRDRRNQVDEELGGQFEDGAEELLTLLKKLRARKIELSEKNQILTQKRDELVQGLVDLRTRLDELDAASNAIFEARVDTCRRINEQLSSFYCRVDQDDASEAVAELKSLKSGLHEPTLAEYARTIDVEMLVARVVDAVAEGADITDMRQSQEAEDRLPACVIESSDWELLARVASTRIEETLEIGYKGETPTKPFEQLTEGQRALAIKEVSFIASDRPVISDQPEDSVPTRSVFDELVPIFNEQRADRQFIIVSHDANIVVGADADRIFVLGTEASDGGPLAGTLFDPLVSRSALDHLEGGEEAFTRRQERYTVLGSPVSR